MQLMGFPDGSMVKSLPAMQEPQDRSQDQEDPLKEGMSTYSSILAQRILWPEKPGGLQFIGCKELGITGATQHACTYAVNTHETKYYMRNYILLSVESVHFFPFSQQIITHSTIQEITWGKLYLQSTREVLAFYVGVTLRGDCRLLWFPSRNAAVALHLCAPLKNIFTIDFPLALIYHLTPSIMRFVG